MPGDFRIYEAFNYLEGLTWWVVAVALPFLVRSTSRRQKFSVYAASVVFVFFGCSDFLEAPLQGRMPAWLWVYKIVCGVALFSCRFTYLGWNTFRFTDRYVLFGLSCLIAVLGVIYLQHVL